MFEMCIRDSKEGDEIVISAMEHHSNIVPWQMLCEERGAKLRDVYKRQPFDPVPHPLAVQS